MSPIIKHANPTPGHKFGWNPSRPDHRDIVFTAPRAVKATLPPKVDLRSKCPPVLDQGELGSCTANAIANAHLFAQVSESYPSPFPPSRLFIYWNERNLEGTVLSDSGAAIRDGFKVINKLGACHETQWPYDISQFKKRPAARCFQDALKYLAISYFAVPQTESMLKACLASGFPFVFGFSVYESFESALVAKTGKANLPGPNESSLGGHAVLCVGYDNTTGRFLIQNSWGSGWGAGGYFTLPYAYLLNSGLASDFWTVRRVAAPK